MPLLPHATALAERGAVPGGTTRNLAALQAHVTFAPALTDASRILLADAQTSGGLLLAVAEERLAALLAALEREETLERAVVGRVVAGPAGTIVVR